MGFLKKIKILIFPASIFSLFIILTSFKIHSSSIGMYHKYFYGNEKDYNLIFGQSRGIRSDEWFVGTPKFISSYQEDFTKINYNLGLGENFAIQGFLTRHWRLIFHPNQWFLFFLPIDYAFSASWWFLSLLMLFGLYFLFLILTRDIFISVLSSLIFFFVPFNQWWSYSLSSFLGYGAFVIIFFYSFLKSKRFFTKLISIFGLIYFSLCFAFIQYPPFQVAVGWLILAVCIGLLLSERKNLFKKDWQWIISGIFFTGVIDLAILAKFYYEFKDIITIIQNTVYPGKRFVADSQGSILSLLNGFYNIQLLDDVKGAGPFFNQSEASNFFLLSLFALPSFLWTLINQIKRKRINWVFFMLNISFILLLLWYFFPWPKILAKISLLYLVPKKRALIGIGLASYFLMLYFLAEVKIKKNFFYRYLSLFLSFFTFFVNLYIGFYLKYNYPVFIQNNYKIILISLFAGFSLYLLLNQYKKLFLSLFLIFSVISTYRVNPLYKGLDPLINTPLAKEIRKIKTDTKNQYFFVNYGSIILENYPLANGAKSLSGVYYYPQFRLLEKLDPEKKYENIYNRYAHVNFLDNPKIKERFILWETDSYGININPCDKFFDRMQAKYFIFNSKVNYKCLKLKKDIKMSNMEVLIYEKN